jgi:tetratricopeptide (TPR) repeat protein
MGHALYRQGRFLEMAGYYRIAQTLRPDNPGVLQGLGMGLYHSGQKDEGLAAYRRALQLFPKSTSVRSRLISVLATTGYWKEAEVECRRGLEKDPTDHKPLFILAEALSTNGRYEEALVLFREVTGIAPHFADAHILLGSAFAQTGRHEDAVTELRKGRELNTHIPHANLLASELAALGRWEEAINVLQTGAVRESKDASYPYEMGKLYRSHNKPEEAARAFQKAVTIAPRYPAAWEELAGALLDLGRFAEARAAIESHLALPPNDAQRRALRRQLDHCNALLAVGDDLSAVLAGNKRPADVATQLALAEWCLKHKRLTATASSFYTSVLAAQPSLADDLEAGYRFSAARAAARAGCGIGPDDAPLDAEQRAALRKRALEWLRAEYAAWAERHRRGNRTVAARAVRSWLKSEDLAGVRDEQALAKLPPDEHQNWQALWAKVSTLAARDPLALFEQARAHGARTEWKKAAECYAGGMELEPTNNGELWFEYAAVQLLAGDRVGYRQTCAAMLARAQGPAPLRAYLVTRACTLASDSNVNRQQLFLQYAKEVSNGREAWALTEKAAWCFREGETDSALGCAFSGLEADARPGMAVLDWLWLALAYQKSGNPNEARRWLNKATDWLDQQGGRMPHQFVPGMGSNLHNWLEAHVLRKEADQHLR